MSRFGYYWQHRVEVYHVSTLIKGYPQALESVFGHRFARKTLQPQSWRHHIETIVSYQSSAVGGYPKKTIRVGKQPAYVVMWQSVVKIDIRQIISLSQDIAVSHAG